MFLTDTSATLWIERPRSSRQTETDLLRLADSPENRGMEIVSSCLRVTHEFWNIWSETVRPYPCSRPPGIVFGHVPQLELGSRQNFRLRAARFFAWSRKHLKVLKFWYCWMCFGVDPHPPLVLVSYSSVFRFSFYFIFVIIWAVYRSLFQFRSV